MSRPRNCGIESSCGTICDGDHWQCESCAEVARLKQENAALRDCFENLKKLTAVDGDMADLAVHHYCNAALAALPAPGAR